MSETAETFRGDSGVFVLVLYFKRAKAKIKRCFISVSFQLCGQFGAVHMLYNVRQGDGGNWQFVIHVI